MYLLYKFTVLAELSITISQLNTDVWAPGCPCIGRRRGVSRHSTQGINRRSFTLRLVLEEGALLYSFNCELNTSFPLLSLVNLV